MPNAQLLELLSSPDQAEAFHPSDDSSRCAVIQVICFEETQNNPSDKYTKEISLIPVCTPVCKHIFHPQMSFFVWVHSQSLCKLCRVPGSLPCPHRVVLTRRQILGALNTFWLAGRDPLASDLDEDLNSDRIKWEYSQRQGSGTREGTTRES